MTSNANPTDLKTKRLVKPIISKSRNHFELVKRLQRAPKIICPAANDAYTLFALFFSDKQL